MLLRCAALLTVARSEGAEQAVAGSEDLPQTWSGILTRAREAGIVIRADYVSETASNLQGGPSRHTLYTDQYTLDAEFDLQRLIRLPDTLFRATVTDRNGRNLSAPQYLNTLQLVQEVYGRGQTWRITRFSVQHFLFDNRMDWKIGRLIVGEDFGAFPCDFMNLTFCGATPGLIASNYWLNWPVSVLATRLRLSSGAAYTQIGAYQVNPNYLQRAYAFTLANPPDATGVLIPLELGWTTDPDAQRLARTYEFGGWYDTSAAPDVFENTYGQPLVIDGGTPRTRHGRYGVYLSMTQQLTHGLGGSPKQGLSAFVNVSATERRTATTDSLVSCGLTYVGPFQSRPADTIAVAWGRTQINPRIAQAEALQIAVKQDIPGTQHSEYVAELDYGLHATGWLTLRPNLQYIHRPGGLDRPDEIIFGLKVLMNFTP